MAEKSISEIVDLASAYYGSAVLFAALDVGVFAAVEKSEGLNVLGSARQDNTCQTNAVVKCKGSDGCHAAAEIYS